MWRSGRSWGWCIPTSHVSAVSHTCCDKLGKKELIIWLSPISPQKYGKSLSSRKGEVSKIHIHLQEVWYRMLKLPDESHSNG